jgi:hypothetical protein
MIFLKCAVNSVTPYLFIRRDKARDELYAGSLSEQKVIQFNQIFSIEIRD